MFSSHWLNRASVGLVVVLVVFLAMVPWGWVFEDDLDRSLRKASELLADEEFDAAGVLGLKVAHGPWRRSEGLLLAARAGARLKRTQPGYLPQLCGDSPASDAPLAQLYDYADRLLDAGRVRDAERALRAVLARDPQHHDANHNLAMLLRFENRFHEAQPFLLELYRQGCFRREYLMTTGLAENRGLLSGGDKFYLDLCRIGTPTDPFPMLNTVRLEQEIANPKSTLRLLEAILERNPDLVEAQARRGWLLLTAGTEDDFLGWNQSLSPTAEKHPLVWVVRAMYAKSHGEPRGAIRCLLQAVELDSCYRQAFYQLTQLFIAIKDVPHSEACAHRAKLLERFESVLAMPPTTLEQLHEAAELAESLDRIWDALGWAHEAVRLFPDSQRSRQIVGRLQDRVSPQTPLCQVARNSDWNIPLTVFPLPNWKSLTKKSELPSTKAALETTTSFNDLASSCGINFVFHNGADPAAGIAYPFELSGGGIGVLDFDCDGWPDLYLSQGCNWPVGQQMTHLDRLFRNVNGTHFEDVTATAGITENGLSQSVSIGDFNADGFPDVYVGNVGPNRLWENNGDGTFRDVTESTGIGGGDWTASAAFGDLNGDGLQDLYVVNYLSGPDLYTRKCLHPGSTVPVQCSPTFFPAAQDRLYQNLGDGRFADLTEKSGIQVPDGKGLSIVLADFSKARRLNIFVANDTTANFYFVNQAGSPGGALRFEEQAVPMGLAYDAAGRAQSSMGVAAGDTNQDGLLDLFVTNFTREFNNLYLQLPGGVFEDQIRESGLAEPGFAMMGWGTQFLDADLDGLDDLFVANGDLYPTSTPYQMPQHFFRNRGNGRFELAGPESLGPYFMRSWLGRAVARLDVDRDGRPDLAVTHVDSPFSLLVNHSRHHGRFLKVRLRGVVSDREAIGATVRVTARAKTWSRQLIGGDGFAVSNERVLIFGLGDTAQIDSITVEWPAGTNDEFQGTITADSELLLVEGSRRVIVLHSAPGRFAE
ncbi:MAG: tetratricopeptide repeat protein [Planctomycetaceae bacterium]|nr:tetratricopeptide repeat protein [Planctomycetaceae bacterium]